MEPISAYPLTWPFGWKRTPSHQRVKSKFKIQFGPARDALLHEIRLLGGRKVILSTNVPLRQDGLPYSNWREPDDPGIAVYFDLDGEPICMGRDKFRNVRDNLHALALSIGALRGIERWGGAEMMKRAFTGFKALPDYTKKSVPWRNVLGNFDKEPPTQEEIISRYKFLAMIVHPDRGGTAEAFQRLVTARNEALAEFGFLGDGKTE